MQEGGRQPHSVVEEDETAFIVHIVIGKGDNAVSRRVKKSACRRSDIDAEVRPPGLAVVIAL